MTNSLPRRDSIPSSAQLALSQEDITRLLNEEAPGVRIDVLNKVADGYERMLYGAREIAVAEQIFRTLVRDAEANVRRSLADRFKDNAVIPKDVARKLAEDEDDEVALPVMESSPLLNDRDLIAIIESSPALSRLLAISRRESVSEQVASALVDTREDIVVFSLLGNEGAEIGEAAFERILEDHADNEEVMGSMAGRSRLPVAVAERLISGVSDSLAARLKEKYGIRQTEAAAEVEKQVEKTREAATLRLLRNLPPENDIDIMVHQLFTGGKLSHSLVLSALCHGHLHFFSSAMARLAGIPVANAAKLVNDRGQLGFPALYAKSGLPESLLPATALVIRGALDLAKESLSPGTVEYADRLAAYVLASGGPGGVPRTSYLLALIRQNYME